MFQRKNILEWIIHKTHKLLDNFRGLPAEATKISLLSDVDNYVL